MASRRTRGIGRGLEAAAAALQQWFALQQQLGLRREEMEATSTRAEDERSAATRRARADMLEKIDPALGLRTLEGADVPETDITRGLFRQEALTTPPEGIDPLALRRGVIPSIGLGEEPKSAEELLRDFASVWQARGGAEAQRAGKITEAGALSEIQARKQITGAEAGYAEVAPQRTPRLREEEVQKKIAGYDPRVTAGEVEQQNVIEAGTRQPKLDTQYAENALQLDQIIAQRKITDPLDLALRKSEEQMRTEEIKKRAAFQKSLEGSGLNLSVTAIERIAGADASLAVLANMRLLYPKVQDAIGPWVATLTEVKMALPGERKIPTNVARFFADSYTLKNAVIKAITGAQMSEPEAKRISAQIPLPSDRPEVWEQKALSTIDNLSLMRQRFFELSGSVSPTASQTPGGAPEPMPSHATEAELTVQAPNGQSYRFQTKEAADTFRRLIGGGS